MSTTDDTTTPTTGATTEPATAAAPWPWTVLGLVILLGLAIGTRWLDHHIPLDVKGKSYAKYVTAIEYPVYAIVLGLLGNVVLTLLGIRDRVAAAFRTEFFIKTGLVLLGASRGLPHLRPAGAARRAGPARRGTAARQRAAHPWFRTGGFASVPTARAVPSGDLPSRPPAADELAVARRGDGRHARGGQRRSGRPARAVRPARTPSLTAPTSAPATSSAPPSPADQSLRSTL
ncbi:hypothetical protein [Dactylosporangium sp. NPDC005555]|uniref:hypothetical protein n=1 Tax=Dactylosporangium sp. NPDC005555 TaxID=3154889 RepID=UPI0033B75373